MKICSFSGYKVDKVHTDFSNSFLKSDLLLEIFLFFNYIVVLYDLDTNILFLF